jgi:hypothetical protein
MKYGFTKHIPLIRCVHFVLVVSVMLCITAAVASVWRSSAVRTDDKRAKRARFLARVRDGVGREVRLSAPGDSSGQVLAATTSVANFIEKRSRVKLSESVKERLAVLEERTLNGAARRLLTTELSQIITTILFEKLLELSDGEVSVVVETLRGFNAPGLPKKQSRNFKLPGGIAFFMAESEKAHVQKIETQIKSVRNQLGTPAGDVFRGMASRVIRERVAGHARYLSEGVPEAFGNMWDVANDRESDGANSGVTPLQAMLVTYSLVSDDYLGDSEVSLERRMKSLQKGLSESAGEPYPDPAGHRPYGVNGYLFSSPLDVMFDEQTINRLLDRVEERGRRE